RIAQGEPATPGYGVAGAGFSSVALPMPFLASHDASITIRAGVENIFNLLYRTHLSTLRGMIRREPGRNLFVSLSLAL
ncbi:MAG TPA: TonB-dependent receptor, partial [Bacteroidota bacterium]|nr:TonB-dependent receptor [Bacteroidota bacterium]